MGFALLSFWTLTADRDERRPEFTVLGHRTAFLRKKTFSNIIELRGIAKTFN